MGWRDLLQPPSQGVFPWLGGRKVFGLGRSYRIEGALPREFGWYVFEIPAGRVVKLVGPAESDPDYPTGRISDHGYLVGDRLIPTKARVDPDPAKFLDQTVPVYLVEPGLDRFPLVQVVHDGDGQLIFTMQILPGPADDDVRAAFLERRESLDGVKGVTPDLDLAFRFATQQRKLAEERREELRKKREVEERLERAKRNMGTSQGRRTLAKEDLEAGVRAALAMGGAELLDVRPSFSRNEIVVQYLFQNRRLECVCDRDTFRIIDSGICLTNHATGESGDTRFTLESLPGVVAEAIRGHRLHIYRHIDRDDPDNEWED